MGSEHALGDAHEHQRPGVATADVGELVEHHRAQPRVRPLAAATGSTMIGRRRPATSGTMTPANSAARQRRAHRSRLAGPRERGEHADVLDHRGARARATRSRGARPRRGARAAPTVRSRSRAPSRPSRDGELERSAVPATERSGSAKRGRQGAWRLVDHGGRWPPRRRRPDEGRDGRVARDRSGSTAPRSSPGVAGRRDAMAEARRSRAEPGASRRGSRSRSGGGSRPSGDAAAPGRDVRRRR